GAAGAGHRGYVADDLAVLVLDGHRMIGPVLGEVRDRLLAAPAVGDAEALEGGCDPYEPGLIRLRGTGGFVRLPVFQFAPDGGPRAVVREVNLLLGADRDPWGAADWWLSTDPGLGRVPAGLLGGPDEGRLLPAARSRAAG
ncbi:hypothetical protein GPJ59_24135, partial [Streptomyces bambusae]|nr:hypothetical protein [Streptomyces bambusae]